MFVKMPIVLYGLTACSYAQKDPKRPIKNINIWFDRNADGSRNTKHYAQQTDHNATRS